MTNLAEKQDTETSVGVSRHWFVDTLKVALNFGGKKDVRYYLNGVCVHFLQNSIAIIATDGHRLFYNESNPLYVPEHLKDRQFILERDSLALLKSLPKVSGSANDNILCMLTPPEERDGFFALLDVSGATTQFSCVDGKFPDYNRVMWTDGPKPTTEIGLDLNYVADLAKLKPIISKVAAAKFEFRGANESLRVTVPSTKSDTNIRIILMPMRL